MTATISLACVFVTCPKCHSDLPSPAGQADWTLDEVQLAVNKSAEGDGPRCPECGQVLTVTLPEVVEVSL
jgi:hypothetical protein